MGRSTGKWKLESKSDPRFNLEGGETDKPSYPIELPPAARSGLNVLSEVLGVEPPDDLDYIFQEESAPRSTQSMRAAAPIPEIPLRWVSDSPEDMAKMLDQEPDGSWRFGYYLIEADFPITPESLAPFHKQILDTLAPLEAQSIPVALIVIRDQVVRVL